MGCRRCSAFNLLATHLGEDGSRSDLLIHELVRTLLLPLLSEKVLGS